MGYNFHKSNETNGSQSIPAVKGAPVTGETAGPYDIKNILFLFVDQQRWDCLGCYGNSVVQTPNIDRLAAHGIRFENTFTPTPLCTPARTSLQTGLWAHNSRVMFNTEQDGFAGGVKDPDGSVRFFSDSMKEKGWNMAHIGKWHIGSEKNSITAHGYDGFYHPGYGLPSDADNAGYGHYSEYLKKFGLNGFRLLSETYDPAGLRLYAGCQEGPPQASLPAYLAGQAIDYIKDYAGQDKPFFVSCNFWGPHEPYCIPEPYFSMYNPEDIQVWPNFNCDLEGKPSAIRRYGYYWKTAWMREKDLAGLIAHYYGYIKLIDHEIGRILHALEQSGELDRTLIVYSADHGSTVGSYRMWAKGFGMYDALTRIPMIISHPSITPSVSKEFTTLLDLAPTFLEIAGAQVPQHLDGISLMPVINGSGKNIRDSYIVTEAFGHVVPLWQRMLRTESTKYIYTFTSEDEFYDLDADPYEMENIAASVDKKILKSYREMLIEEMKKNGDPLLYWAQSTIL